MNSLLLWIGGLLVAVLGLLFAVPHLIDWNTYRGVFEEEATRILGRDVRVGGKVNLRLLPTPYVRFEKVRISDSGASLGEPFFRAEAFTLWLSPTPLLRGAIEAHEVELDQPVLRLAVDGGGNGNWQQLKITPGSLPFVPSDVVLQQVRIRNGIVSLRTPSTPEPLTLTGIDGELAATSLEGPYRFRGNVGWSGVVREVRFATQPREPDGKMRYKAAIRAVDSSNVYSLDGLLTELSAKARHTGVLTARLPLAGVIGDGAAGNRAGRGGEIIDLKANVEGDIDGLRLSDVQLGFEQDGKPQLISGEATATWRNGLRTETRLTSRWLDLDQIVGRATGSVAPALLVRSVIDQLGSMLPVDGASVLTIDADQVNVGGDALSGVRLAMARAGGLTSIGELRVGLPGNARGELRGTFAVAPPAQGGRRRSTVGAVRRRGRSAWGELSPVCRLGRRRRSARGGRSGGSRPDSSFSLSSRVRLSPERLELSGATLEVGQHHHTGSLDWRWGRDRSLQIAVEGQTIDIAPVAAGVLDPASVRMGPGGSVPLADTGSLLLSTLAARAVAVERAVGRLAVKLRASALTDGAVTLNDVEADFGLSGEQLEITGLKFKTSSAGSVELRGQLSAVASRPQGSVRGWIGAGSRQGFAGIADLLPSGVQAVGAGWLNHIADADLGFVLSLGAGEGGSASIQANGLVEGARVGIDLKLDGGLGRWREAPIDLSMSIEGGAAASIARRMAGAAGPRDGEARAGTAVPATLHIKAAGATATTLLTRASLATKDTRAAFNGRAVVDAIGGGVALTGDLTIEAAEAADLLMMAGAARRPGIGGVPVQGTVAVVRKGGSTRISGSGLEIGGVPVAGDLVVADKGERTRIDGKISAGRIALMGLLGLVLDGETRTVAGAGTPDTSGPSPWPDTPLSLALLDRIEGQITLTAPSALLADGLELTGAEASIGLSPGRLTIASLTGGALGGRFTLRGAMESAPAGANLTLDTRITGAQLARLGGGADAGRDLGEGNLTLALSGRATSLRAATAQLTGRGEIELRNARVEGVGAEILDKVALAAIEGGEATGVEGLQGAIAAQLARSNVAAGNRKLTVEVADGIARIGVLEIATPEASLRNATTVDVAALRADSEWRITSAPSAAGISSQRTARAVAVDRRGLGRAARDCRAECAAAVAGGAGSRGLDPSG